ncbi:MAG: SurA N-terminal domain-containing protein [Candidatus Omnitrophota bacterium]
MLKTFRNKKVMKIILWGIVIAIVIGFGILGNAYLLNEQRASGPGSAGKVFGRNVSLEDFEKNYQFTLIQLQLQHGENFGKVLQTINLEEKVWERIMLLEQARREGIKVVDNEVAEIISRYPFFFNQQTKRFDPAIYQMVLQNGFKMTARAFEERIRDDLKIQKLFDRQTFTVMVTEEEIINAYKEFNEKARVSYVLFPAEDFTKSVIFDENKAKIYFQENQKRFIQPPAANLAYFKFIFDESSADSKDLAYDKAFQAMSLIRNGNSFTEVAAQINASVKNTGFFDIQKPDLSLGWPSETFRNILNMKVGESTEIVTTDSSYDIIQLQEIRPPSVPDYEEIKNEVQKAWTDLQALELSKAKAESVLPLLDPINFNASAEAQGLKARQTPDFSLGQYLPEIGTSAAFQYAAFDLTAENPLSNAVETEKGFAILHLDERIAIDMDKYAKEKDMFGQNILSLKKMKLFSEYVDSLKEKAQIKDLISDYLKNQQ